MAERYEHVIKSQLTVELYELKRCYILTNTIPRLPELTVRFSICHAVVKVYLRSPYFCLLTRVLLLAS